jgi:hypothetical protein
MATPSNPGKIIRIGILTLFFGTIILGALSFVIYFGKEKEKTSRTLKYAATLRQPIAAEGLTKHQVVIESLLLKPAPARATELSSYLASTMGPENMGYALRELTSPETKSRIAFDAELTGTQRPRDIVMVLAGLNVDPAINVAMAGGDVSRPLAAVLAIAHSQTAQARLRTIRFTVLNDMSALEPYYKEAVDGRERITHLLLLGGATTLSDAEALKSLHTAERGTQVLRPTLNVPLPASAKALEQQLIDLAERL